MAKIRFAVLPLLLLSVFGTIQAQSWQWARQVYGPNKDEILCVETDPWNNIYIGGRFRDTVRFSPTVFFTTSVGYYDGFIAKYDSSGSLLWVRTFGGNANDYATALSVDDSGNVYMAGYGRSTTPVTYDSFSYVGTGNDKTFILKINPQGNLVWGKLVTHGISNAYPAAIGVNNGIVSVTGNYGFLNMIIETDTLLLKGSEDVFIATYSAYTGNLLWTKALQSQFMDYAYELVVDDSGNVYTAGIHNGSLSIAGVDSLMNPAGYEVYLCKFSPAGVYQWSKRYRGTGDHLVDAMALNPNGSLYIAGWHSSGNHTLNDTTFNMLFAYNFFLQKVSPGGNSLWTRHYHGNSLGRIIGMACDPFDIVYFTGYLGSQYNIDTFQLTGFAGNYKAFLARISGSGNVLHALTGGDAVNNAGYNNVAADNQGNAYLIGYFGSVLGQHCIFGSDTLISSGGSDGFLVRFSPASPPPCIVNASFTATQSFICTGDSVTFLSTSQNATQIQWLVNGSPAGINPGMELVVVSPGAYTVQLIASNAACSDTATTVLIAPQPANTIFYDTICQGDTLVFGTNSCTTSGSYTTLFPVAGGCDSLHTLHLHVNPSYHQYRFDTICHGDTIYLNYGQIPAFSSGTHTETLHTTSGCDSITTLYLTVDSIIASFTINRDTATAASGYPYYQWLNCDLGMIPVVSAINPVFSPAQSGNFAVAIGSGLCTDTSFCQYILINSIMKEETGGRITLLPNPASTSVNVIVSEDLKVNRAMIYTANGKLLKDIETNENRFMISLHDISPGLLFLFIHTNNGVSMVRFVKNIFY